MTFLVDCVIEARFLSGSIYTFFGPHVEYTSSVSIFPEIAELRAKYIIIHNWKLEYELTETNQWSKLQSYNEICTLI